MSKQTAVEWLRTIYENRPAYEEFILDEEWEQAKEMERFQIEGAYNDGAYDSKQNQYKGMHDYFKENYGGENEQD
jgi:hypothetical protein